MQYVRSLGSGVSKTWNSINPATLSGAIDVIVIEQEDGSLACSPFHVRFGKFSLLRPFEKKVEFKVNGVKQDHSMKLGEGGEAFFVFETSNDIPEALQTSPLVSPAGSPSTLPIEQSTPGGLTDEPSYLDITEEGNGRTTPGASSNKAGTMPIMRRAGTTIGDQSIYDPPGNDVPPDPWSGSRLRAPLLDRSASEELLPTITREQIASLTADLQRSKLSPPTPDDEDSLDMRRPASPPSLKSGEAYHRAMTLSKKLSTSNIRSQVTESGDLMLDMTGYKTSEESALRAEAIARKLLSEEMEESSNIGQLIGTDEKGNLWIYSSEEAKEAANKKATEHNLGTTAVTTSDAASDPGYHSDSDRSSSSNSAPKTHQRAQSEELQPTPRMGNEQNRNFAKTLRLTSDQLKKLDLKPGPNQMSFTVNRATCQAYMYLWTNDVPIVISDIDGTITKSDALGHILNMVGRDWTHIGVAKLYSDIAANGYNIFYLTSRSVGQADTTRAYLNGVTQEGWKLPRGPVIMSPDRTIAALRREIYLRKPEVFKMACLRDILSLFPGRTNPFYAGFGNRFTDALSYRTVKIPSSRIFTINANAEVSLDLLTLTKYKSSYTSMREVVDHFFPPVSTLVKEGGEQYTDFTYWRDDPEGLDDFVPTDSEDEDEDDDQDSVNDLGDSYLSRDSVDQLALGDSIRESIEVDDDAEVAVSKANTRDEDFTDDYLGDKPRTVRSQTVA